MKNITALLFFLFISTQSCQKNDIPQIHASSVTVWNEEQHNAFPDLIKYSGYYYCAFRIATDHSGFDGKLRVIKSADGKNWNAFSLLSINNMDIRDGHFFIDNKNNLTLSLNIRNTHDERQNVSYKLVQDSFIKSDLYKVDNDYMLWNFATLNNNIVYSIGYNVKQICFNSVNSQKPGIMLFNNADENCEDFEKVNVTKSLTTQSFHCPCEPSIVITPDSTMIMIVRDENTPGSSHFGVSKFPYKTWKWTKFPYFVRGPKLALLPDGKLFLAAGSMVEYYKTYYAIINPANFSVEKIESFRSGGDTGYPGIIIEGNTALVSYYSSHDNNTRVYIERITY